MRRVKDKMSAGQCGDGMILTRKMYSVHRVCSLDGR